MMMMFNCSPAVQLLLSQKEQFEWSSGLQSESKPGQLELSAQPANNIFSMIFQRHNSISSSLYFFTSNNFLIIYKQDLEHIAGFDKTCTSQSQARTQSPNQGTLCRSFREIFVEIVALWILWGKTLIKICPLRITKYQPFVGCIKKRSVMCCSKCLTIVHSF